MVKNQPSNAGDEGLIPGLGTKIPHALEELRSRATTTEPRGHRWRVCAAREDPHDATKTLLAVTKARSC